MNRFALFMVQVSVLVQSFVVGVLRTHLSSGLNIGISKKDT